MNYLNKITLILALIPFCASGMDTQSMSQPPKEPTYENIAILAHQRTIGKISAATFAKKIKADRRARSAFKKQVAAYNKRMAEERDRLLEKNSRDEQARQIDALYAQYANAAEGAEQEILRQINKLKIKLGDYPQEFSDEENLLTSSNALPTKRKLF